MNKKTNGPVVVSVRTTKEKKDALLKHSKRLNVSQRFLFDMLVDSLEKIERIETQVFKVSQ